MRHSLKILTQQFAANLKFVLCSSQTGQTLGISRSSPKKRTVSTSPPALRPTTCSRRPGGSSGSSSSPPSRGPTSWPLPGTGTDQRGWGTRRSSPNNYITRRGPWSESCICLISALFCFGKWELGFGQDGGRANSKLNQLSSQARCLTL